MSTAHQMYEEQRQADKSHHEGRLNWLRSDNPAWADGTPVNRQEVKKMIKQIIEALRLINGHGMMLNHCGCKPRCGA